MMFGGESPASSSFSTTNTTTDATPSDYSTPVRDGGGRYGYHAATQGGSAGAATVTGFGASRQTLEDVIRRQDGEMRQLRDANMRLRAREVEISSLTVKLQQQFVATQGQLDHIKSTVRLQLLNPISESEYLRIEQRPEQERDLVDTLKVGIYQQLGSLRAGRDTAVRKASEMALEIESLQAKLRSATQDASDHQLQRTTDATTLKRTQALLDTKNGLEMELQAKLRDVEARLVSAVSEQERSIDTRVQLQHKISEVARLEMLLRQADGDVARHKTAAECADHKLDILKSEYYDLKLDFSQRVLTLEAALRQAQEKLSMVADVELEAEVFIANLATQQDMNEANRIAGSAAGGGGGGALACVPPSRRMQHALTVTKRCLTLENQVAALKHELAAKDESMEKLQRSLELARSALASQDGGASYAVIEGTVNSLTRAKESLEAQKGALSEENAVLRRQVSELQADLQVLASHRNELIEVREQLKHYAASLQQAARGGGGAADGSPLGGTGPSSPKWMSSPTGIGGRNASAVTAAPHPNTSGSSAFNNSSSYNYNPQSTTNSGGGMGSTTTHNNTARTDHLHGTTTSTGAYSLEPTIVIGGPTPNLSAAPTPQGSSGALNATIDSHRHQQQQHLQQHQSHYQLPSRHDSVHWGSMPDVRLTITAASSRAGSPPNAANPLGQAVLSTGTSSGSLRTGGGRRMLGGGGAGMSIADASSSGLIWSDSIIIN